MLHFLPSFILIPFSFTLFCLNLALCGFLIFLGGVFKFLIPLKFFQKLMYSPMHFFFRTWAFNNVAIINLCNKVEWQISGDEQLSKNSWYLLISNHISWLDIFIIANFTRTRIPEAKFFLKESLKKVPFIGMACWALDMPFMKRYSRKFVEKYPHLRGKDIETTKKSCEKFKSQPTSIINFIEGTRFTHKKSSSDGFKHLLPPKAGGIAFTLAAMGEQFDKVLNITLCYPDNQGHVMNDLLAGKVKRIILHVEQLEVSDELIGDYFNDQAFKEKFQAWLNNLWLEKDQLLSRFKGQA